MNNLSRIVFFTDIKFCWTKQLFNITCIGIWRTGVICTCITFCWTRQLLNITLFSPVVFEGRGCVYLYYILLNQTVIYHYFD